MENESSKIAPPTSTSVAPARISILEAVLVVIVTFGLVIFLGGLLLFLNAAVALIVGELLFLAVPFVYLLFKRINIKTFVKANFRTGFLLLGIGFGVLLLLVNVAVSGILTAIFGTSQAAEEVNRLFIEISKSPAGLVAVVASLSLAGVCEEFIFRGFLQNTISQKHSFLTSVVVSALVFGIAHFDPQLIYMIATFILGLILGSIYHRWNYVVSATAHSTMNIIVLVALLLTL